MEKYDNVSRKVTANYTEAKNDSILLCREVIRNQFISPKSYNNMKLHSSRNH